MRFEHPQVLWLVLVLPVLVLLFRWWSQRVRRRLLMQFVQARLLPDLTVGLSTRRRKVRAWLFTAAGALLMVALARPQWGFTWEEARQKGLDIVVAIDTSKSMLAEDIRPNRLARAKLAALDLMQQARADRLGVIAFAGGAFLQCPLTLDDGAFRQCIDALDVNIIPQGGTALAEAIRTATRAFMDNDDFKVLILFTDGEDHDPGALDAAAEAAEAGLRIYTIGLGTEEGEILRVRDEKGQLDYVRDSQGQVVKSRLDESLLQQIAGSAQGFYLPLRGADTVETLYARGLAALPRSESEARLFQRYHEQYHWPLALALVLLLIQTLLPERKRERVRTRGSAAPALAASLVLLLPGVLPATASPGGAARAYETGNYKQALQEFDRLREKQGEDPRLHYNAGAAAFRAGQYADAVQRFSLATGAPDLSLQQLAYYNRGNASYRQGEDTPDTTTKREAWERAVQDYEAALKLNPEDQDARFNLEFVKRRLEELKQQQQRNQNQNQNQEQQEEQEQSESDGGDEAKPNERSGQQEKPDQEQAGDQEPSEAQSTGDQGAQPGGGAESLGTTNMSPQQAAQILDSLKGEEQMLPIQLMMPRPQHPPSKDW